MERFNSPSVTVSRKGNSSVIKFKAKSIGLVDSSLCGAMKTIFHVKLDISNYDESLSFEVIMSAKSAAEIINNSKATQLNSKQSSFLFFTCCELKFVIHFYRLAHFKSCSCLQAQFHYHLGHKFPGVCENYFLECVHGR